MMLNKDNYWTGLLIGIAATVVFYGILYGVNLLVVQTLGRPMVEKSHYLMLLSVIPNLLLLRYYLVRKKFTKTGLSILTLTLLFVLLYFINYFQNPQ
ncbi:MAG: hypothetical protein DRJ09_12745 [Bacteroidetes bacterium]|nr:MAG: hypothetical protein DRJ09_12745 [Bacteroidota bacterium]